MTVGANRRLGGAVDAEAANACPSRSQGAGGGLAGQVHGQGVRVAVAQGGELARTPVARWAAQQQVKPGAARARPASTSGRRGRCAHRAAGRRPVALGARVGLDGLDR